MEKHVFKVYRLCADAYGVDEGYEDLEFAYFDFKRNIDFAWKTNR